MAFLSENIKSFEVHMCHVACKQILCISTRFWMSPKPSYKALPLRKAQDIFFSLSLIFLPTYLLWSSYTFSFTEIYLTDCNWLSTYTPRCRNTLFGGARPRELVSCPFRLCIFIWWCQFRKIINWVALANSSWFCIK